MKQKIEWYREVLELEPGSRVFFPLARMLAADGRIKEAADTLRLGIVRHPDHMEARFLLVELLYANGRREEAGEEVDGLAKVFKLYPHFWEAWSGRLAEIPEMCDAAVSLRFFAASLAGRQVSWAGVIEKGLCALLGSGFDAVSGLGASGSVTAASVLGSQAAAAQVGKIEARGVADTSEDLDDDSEEDEAYADEAEERAPSGFISAIGEAEFSEEDEPEEPFSLRTRSMAEVLAEQGDVAGAMDIYRELLKNASDEQKSELEMRIAELNDRITAAEEGIVPVESVASRAEDKNRLVLLLESLAERLEARSQ